MVQWLIFGGGVNILFCFVGVIYLCECGERERERKRGEHKEAEGITQEDGFPKMECFKLRSLGEKNDVPILKTRNTLSQVLVSLWDLDKIGKLSLIIPVWNAKNENHSVLLL